MTLTVLLAMAAGLRAYRLGASSFWYDEVVTMRLARAAGPAALLERLQAIDATRAPLHPLLLHYWIALFGASEAAGRAFSVVCGVATVGLVFRIGSRLLDDRATGFWAAALAAVSPALVIYSREARMYAWLVMIACLAWDALWTLRDDARWPRLGWLAVCLTALGYSHPLGLIMAGTLALAAALGRRGFGLSWPRLAVPFALAGIAVAPWVGRYLDHEPESTVGRLPVRFLLGMPIGYLGGDFAVLAGFVGLIAWGSVRWTKGPADRARPEFDRPLDTMLLLVWLTVPPVVLYVYSWLSHPIFGPERYTLFVAPAYLVLVARGIARFRTGLRWAVGGTALALAITSLPDRAFAPDLKADWRGAAALIDWYDPRAEQPVVVASADPRHNVEVEAARYYLGPRRPVLPLTQPPEQPPGDGPTWYAVGLRGGRAVAALPAEVQPMGNFIDLPGLRLGRVPPVSVFNSDRPAP